jgi:hypothetical protein
MNTVDAPIAMVWKPFIVSPLSIMAIPPQIVIMPVQKDLVLIIDILDLS